MIALVPVVLFVVWVVWLRRRAKRRLVAGLVPERPGFFIEPPGGRLGSLKDWTL